MHEFNLLQNLSDEENSIVSHTGRYINNDNSVVVDFVINHKMSTSVYNSIEHKTISENLKTIDDLILQDYCKRV
jgi:hypothetical protein